MRRLYGAAAAAVLVLTVGGCGNKAETGGGGGGAAANWPQRDLRIMAPADPGGGWDATARALGDVPQGQVLDNGVEVYNVHGAGGTLGLSQLSPSTRAIRPADGDGARDARRDRDEQVADVTSSKTTPIATLTTETEAIVVPAKSKYKSLKRPRATTSRPTRRGRPFAGGSAGGTDQILLGLLAKAAGVDASKPKYVAYSGGGEANAAILSGSVEAGISGVSEFADQVEAGKMRVLAVSGAERRGRAASRPDDQGAGLRRRAHELARRRRRRRASPTPSARPRSRRVQKMHDSPEWQQKLEAQRLDGLLQDRRRVRVASCERRRRASRASSPSSGSAGEAVVRQGRGWQASILLAALAWRPASRVTRSRAATARRPAGRGSCR